MTSAASSLSASVQSPLALARTRISIVPLTIEQYQRMVEDGIVAEDGAVELLRGVMVRKDRSDLGENPMGHSPLHVLVVSLLSELASRINCDRWHMKIQLPVACPPDGAPEPDASIVRGSPRDYGDRLPGPGDVSCVIEVAHSSLERDRDDKLPIYAGAEIPQCVIINLQNHTIEVYRNPDRLAEQYRTKSTLERAEKLDLLLPEGVFTVNVADLLP
jgi:Uma2 family endonuclease